MLYPLMFNCRGGGWYVICAKSVAVTSCVCKFFISLFFMIKMKGIYSCNSLSASKNVVLAFNFVYMQKKRKPTALAAAERTKKLHAKKRKLNSQTPAPVVDFTSNDLPCNHEENETSWL